MFVILKERIFKVWLLSAMMLTATVVCEAAERSDSLKATDVFAKLPHQVLDMLRPSVRLDMIDYYSQADSLLPVLNALNGESRLEEVTDDYLRVRITPVSTLEIKLLPRKEDVIVMTLYTIGGNDSAADTKVDFFDSALCPLKTDKYLKAPASKDFFRLKNSGISAAELNELLPYSTVRYSASASDTGLKAELTALVSLPEEDRTRLEKLLIPELISSWKGKYLFKD